MNGTTKQRYISTSIWADDWFDSLSEREKLVYFYLLTNEHTNAAGVYQCTLKNVRLEIGLNRDEIDRVMAKFAEAGKAFYYREYIIIPKWLKHQKISERSKMFLGAAQVLKSLPAEIKAFISDRRHYDYDVSSIIGKVCIGNAKAMDSLPEENRDNPDTLSQKSDSLSIAYQKNGIAYAENGDFSAHDSDLDSDPDPDFESEFDFDKNINPDTLSQHFISLWQGNADVFNCLARIKLFKDWQAFWEQNTMPIEQIESAVTNFVQGVKSGAIERRYIPASPDAFVLNGWIARSQSPFLKKGQQQQSHRIENDNVSDDDINTYFRRPKE